MEEQQVQVKKSNKMVIIIIIIIVVIGAAVGVYFVTQGGDDTNTAPATNTATTTNATPTQNTNQATADSAANAKPYDGKTFNVSSADGKIEGLAGVKYTEFEGYEYIFVGFFFKIHEAISTKSDNIGNFGYSLLANHIKSTETRVNSSTVSKGTNMLGGIYCEKDHVPDIFEIVAGNSYDQTIRYIDCTWGTPEAWADTDLFYYSYTKTFSIDTFTLEDIYEINKLEIYDASQYHVEEMYEGLESSYIDTEAAFANAPIVVPYTLEYKER